jgi:hypothetical protein
MLPAFAHQGVIDERNHGSRSWQPGEDIVPGHPPQAFQVEPLALE